MYRGTLAFAPIPDAQTVAERWTQGMGQAGTKMTQGANAVQTSPGQLAAAKAQKWINNVNAAAPKWQRNVARVTLEDWRSAFVSKGIPRVATGAQAAQGTFATRIAPVLQYEANLQARVRAMDDTTLAARINRMVEWANGMAQFQSPA